MSLKIRFANPSDTNLIYSFICELAEYERLRDDVTATPELLHESLFVKKQAEVLIAELPGVASELNGDVPVGFALFFHNFSTFKGRACLYLEDIYIKPEYRSKGYGKQIFKKLIEIAVERKCDRFDWSVLNWNEPAINFYKSLGAVPMADWTVYRLSGERLCI